MYHIEHTTVIIHKKNHRSNNQRIYIPTLYSSKKQFMLLTCFRCNDSTDCFYPGVSLCDASGIQQVSPVRQW